jgi:hypothetical protein
LSFDNYANPDIVLTRPPFEHFHSPIGFRTGAQALAPYLFYVHNHITGECAEYHRTEQRARLRRESSFITLLGFNESGNYKLTKNRPVYTNAQKKDVHDTKQCYQNYPNDVL